MPSAELHFVPILYLSYFLLSDGNVIQTELEDIFYNAKIDLVFAGHVHACECWSVGTLDVANIHISRYFSFLFFFVPPDERSCRVYKNKCDPNGYYAITIGDGGNREGLATGKLLHPKLKRSCVD